MHEYKNENLDTKTFWKASQKKTNLSCNLQSQTKFKRRSKKSKPETYQMGYKRRHWRNYRPRRGNIEQDRQMAGNISERTYKTMRVNKDYIHRDSDEGIRDRWGNEGKNTERVNTQEKLKNKTRHKRAWFQNKTENITKRHLIITHINNG